MSTNYINNEKELVLQIASGSERAFGEFFSYYYPQLFSLVRRFSLNDEDVREALQETFLQVWLQRDMLAEVQNMRGWLLRIATRQCRAVLRKNLVIQRSEHKIYEDALMDAQPMTEAVPTSVAEISKLVRDAVMQMPDQRRRIYQLSREEGLKPSEIATHLSLSVSTVKNTLVTALKQIRDHLARAGYPLPWLLICWMFLYA
ncbi:RNA polymerase sigma factor [Chitinophaga eiseniae]|uniref:Sigma-70 family RNA polymerase sigma factor n=1 Tax=Chitinophaga eiseniae TaxID=634771 RepID=A0A847S580_9BACT|nr:sigma-70 family RNA polymerase sigma factor [Chitinophaga eiseniae]NLR78420.1 sigma-70 family RNA polymerase sigma factor [Chitinophaga eiseniae]